MKLDIISPEKLLYRGDAESVTLPGLQGSFTILENHAPIISGLSKGIIEYHHAGKEDFLEIAGGFVEAKNNVVSICVE